MLRGHRRAHRSASQMVAGHRRNAALVTTILTPTKRRGVEGPVLLEAILTEDGFTIDTEDGFAITKEA